MPPCTPEKTKPSSASSSISISKPHRPRDIDPLLKDLSEKKHSFRRNVVSMVSEMKEFRTRLSLQEQSFAKETLTRQEAESKANSLQEEISRLQKSLEEKNEQLQASTSDNENYLSELDGLRTQLTLTQSAADASAASAESAHFQCTSLRTKLDSKNNSLTEQEQRLKRMEEQLDNLQNNLQVREVSQNHLKEEMLRVERDIVQAIADQSVTAEDRNCEIRKLLDEVSSKNLKKMNELLSVKDEEIARLKDEIETLSAHWRFKSRELEAQLDKHQKADQDLKRRILKLEFCLQEARSQTRKLQRMGERRDKAIKELRDQMSTKQQHFCAPDGGEKPNFWENSSFKVLVSMSMLVLVVFSKP